MKFAHVSLLFLIWIVPALLLLVWHAHTKRRSILSRYACAQALKRIVPDAAPGRRIVKSVLLLLALVCLIVALAGPQYGYSWQSIERKGVSLVVALDCSKSMLASDIKPDRLKRAKREILDLLGMLKGDKIGLVAFAGTAFLQCPLTLDYSAFNIFLDALSPDFLPVGGTDLAGAITTATQAFSNKDRSDRAVILITDGESTTPGAIKAAKKAAEEKIKIFCIGVGSPEGAPVPDGRGGFAKDAAGNTVHTRLDEGSLEKIAALTGGAYVRSVTGDMDLDAIYTQQIRSTMQASTLQTSRRKQYTDRYQWFLGLAVFFLLAEMLLPGARRTNGKNNAGTALKAGMLCLLAGALFLTLGSGTAHAAHGDVKKGLKAFQQDDYKGALDAFLKAQVDDPDNPTLLYNVGSAHYKLEHYQQALNNFRAALQRVPGAREAGLTGPAAPAMQNTPGKIHGPMQGQSPGTPPGALSQQPQEPKPLPQQSRELAARTLYNMGNASYRLNQLPAAVRYYEKTLQLDPKDEDARNNLEFVKKKLQEEQPKSCNNPQRPDNTKEPKKDSRQDQKGQKNPDKQGQQQDKNGQKGKQKQQAENGAAQKDRQKQQPQQGQQDPEYGSRMKKKDLQQQPEKQQAGAPAAQPQQQQPEKKNARQAQGSSPLNRLEDKPGRALLPRYQPRRVEKDW